MSANHSSFGLVSDEVREISSLNNSVVSVPKQRSLLSGLRKLEGGEMKNANIKTTVN